MTCPLFTEALSCLYKFQIVDETGKQKKKHSGKLLPHNESERIRTHAYLFFLYQNKPYAGNFEIDAMYYIISYFLVNFTEI